MNPHNDKTRAASMEGLRLAGKVLSLNGIAYTLLIAGGNQSRGLAAASVEYSNLYSNLLTAARSTSGCRASCILNPSRGVLYFPFAAGEPSAKAPVNLPTRSTLKRRTTWSIHLSPELESNLLAGR